jgi:hypothetical protein
MKDPVSFQSSSDSLSNYFPAAVCPSSRPHVTIHVTSNPHDNFTYSGKLVDEKQLPVTGAHVVLTVKYDQIPGYPHEFLCLKATCVPGSQGQDFSLLPPATTKADGTFSGSFLACDNLVRPGGRLSSNAHVTAQYNNENVGVSDEFTTMPCSGVVPTIHHP